MGNVMILKPFARTKAKAFMATILSSLLAIGSVLPAQAAAGAASDSATSGYYGVTPVVIDVLANDTPSDGATFTTLKLCGEGEVLETCSQDSITNAAGTYDVTSNPDKVTFTAARYFSGSAPSVSYAVSDDSPAVFSSTIAVTVNAPTGPTSVADTKTVAFNSTATIAVLDNDTAGVEAIDNTTLKICSGTVTLATNCTDTEVTVTNQGTFTVSAGSVGFTPATDFTGTVTSIKYVVQDAASQYSALATITVKVVGLPTANDDSSSAVVNTDQNVSPLNNDSVATNTASVTLDSTSLALCSALQSAPDCDQTSVSITGKGSFSLATGVVTFSPDTDYVGTASVDYQVADTLGQTVSATITFTVTAAPVSASASDDTNSAGWDVTQSSIDVLANDVPATGETFTANTVRLCLGTEALDQHCTQTSRTIANVGTYTANSDGTITFNPVDTFTGSNAIDYEVTDTTPSTVRATLTVTVEDPTPGTTANDTALTGINKRVDVAVLTNDTKGAADLSTSVKLCADVTDTSGCALTSLVVADEGTYSVNLDGTIRFTPATDVTGEQSPIAYEAFDITGQSAGTSTLTVTVIPAPTATADTSSAAKGEVQTVTPLENDTVSDLADSNGVGFDAATLKLCGLSPVQSAPNCNKTSLAPTAGTVALAAGVVTFTPTASFAGDLVISYQATDELGQVVTATITFTSIAPAVARDDTSSDDYNVVQTVDVLANDTSSTGANFDSATVFICQGAEEPGLCAETEYQLEGSGTFTVTDAGEIEFTPDPSFGGGSVSITYEVTDSSSSSARAYVTVTVARPAKPVLASDENQDDYSVVQTVDVLANDTNHDAELNSSTLRMCSASTTLAASCTLTRISKTGVGVVEFTEAGEIKFTPSSKFWGDYAIAYTVADVTGQYGNPVTVTFTVDEPADETINDDYSAGVSEAVQTIDVIANDRPGTKAFAPTTLKLCSPSQLVASACNLTTYTVANEGVYAVTAAGKITFTPDAAFTGESQTLARYTVADTDGVRFGIARIHVAVIAAPTAVADASSEAYDQNHTVAVTTNDTLGSDVAATYDVAFDATSLRLCSASQTSPNCDLKKLIVPGVGIFTVDTVNGNVLFNPSASFAGEANPISYQISDSLGQETSSTLTVTVGDPAPASLTDDTSFAKQGATQVINVLSNDVRGDAYLNPGKVRICDDLEGAADNPCSLTTLTVASEGTYTVRLDGSIQFVPLANATGVMTTISYQVADVTGQVTSPADLVVSVIAKPTTVNDTSSVAYDTNAVKNVLTNDSISAVGIANGVTLVSSTVRLCAAGKTPPNCTATSLTIKNQGVFTVNTSTGVITFDPSNVFRGVSTSVTYIVKDSLGQVSSATFTVTVANPAPATIVNNTGWSKFGAVQKFNLSANDTAGGAPLVAKSVRLCAAVETNAANCALTSLTVAGEGTYSVNTKTGQVTFTPAANFVGVAAAVKYSVADITGFRSAIGTLTVTVVGKPLLVNDTASSSYLQAATFTPLENDSVSSLATSKGVTLDNASLRLCAKGQNAGKCNATKVTVAGEGTYTLNTTTKVVTFTPLATFAGSTTGLKYQVKDSLGQAQTATLVATVDYPAPSILIDDSAIAGVAIAKTINVLTNDLSVGAAINKSSVKLCSPTALLPSACNLLTLTVAGEGTYTVNQSTGAITFKSVSDFSGDTTPVAYTVADITGQRASMAAIALIVVDGPQATNDSSTDAYDVTQTVAVLDNDEPSDLETANSIEVVSSSLRICAVGKFAPNCSLRSLTVSSQGTFTLNLETSEISFNPLPTFAGVAKVKYQVSDELGNVSGAEVTFTVESPDLGTLSDDAQNVVQGTKAVIDVLANDTRGDAPYKVSSVRLCAVGELTGAACSLTALTVLNEGTYRVDTATGKVSFTSVRGFTGPTTDVRYSVADITGQKAVPATITLTVNAVP